MSKHTPGPWRIDCNQFGTMPTAQWIVRSVTNDDNGVSDRKNGVMVVGVGDCGWDDCDGPPLTGANARLIAAAPTMLEVLEEVMLIERLSSAGLMRVRSAIADAKGGGR